MRCDLQTDPDYRGASERRENAARDGCGFPFEHRKDYTRLGCPERNQSKGQ